MILHKNNKDNLGRMFHDVIEGFDEDLPIRVWDNVSSELVKEKGRKKFITYISIAASIAIIIAFGSGYYMALNKVKRTSFAAVPFYKRSIIKIPVKAIYDEQKIIAEGNALIQNKLIQKNANIINSTILSEKALQNYTLSYNQNNTILKQDTLDPAKDAAFNKNENIAENTILNTVIDSSNIKKALPNLTKIIVPQNDNQTSILNKNTNNVINNIPEKKNYEAENESSKWSLAEQFSPVYSFGLAQKDALSEAATQGYSNNSLPDNESYKQNRTLLVFATGINFKYHINKKWGVKSGLYYATGTLNSGLQHKQIEVPLMADFALINKKFIWELDGGLSTNFLFSGVSKPINYSAMAGTTLGYNVSKKIAISIQPTLKYNFSLPDNYFHYYPISFAFYTGLSYKF